MVFQAEMARHLAGMVQLTPLRFLETDGKGMQSRMLARSQGGHQRGIDPAAQKHAHRHIRVETAPDAVIENPFNLAFGDGHGNRAGSLVRKIPVSVQRQRALAIDHAHNAPAERRRSHSTPYAWPE